MSTWAATGVATWLTYMAVVLAHHHRHLERLAHLKHPLGCRLLVDAVLECGGRLFGVFVLPLREVDPYSPLDHGADDDDFIFLVAYEKYRQRARSIGFRVNNTSLGIKSKYQIDSHGRV
jgi:hypothetical protein